MEMFSEGDVGVFDGGDVVIGLSVGKLGANGPCGRHDEVQWKIAVVKRTMMVCRCLAMFRKDGFRKCIYSSRRKYPRKQVKSGQECWIDVVRRDCADRSVRGRVLCGPRRNTG